MHARLAPGPRPAIEPGTSEARGRREVWPLCARPVPRLCVDSNMRSVFTPALEVYDLIPSRAIDIVSASKTKWPAMRAPDLISACNCNAHGKSFEELSSLPRFLLGQCAHPRRLLPSRTRPCRLEQQLARHDETAASAAVRRGGQEHSGPRAQRHRFRSRLHLLRRLLWFGPSNKTMGDAERGGDADAAQIFSRCVSAAHLSTPSPPLHSEPRASRHPWHAREYVTYPVAPPLPTPTNCLGSGVADVRVVTTETEEQ